MARKDLLDRTTKSLKRLSDERLIEVSNFVESLLNKSADQQLYNDILNTAHASETFSFLEEEEELYFDEDLKETYELNRKIIDSYQLS